MITIEVANQNEFEIVESDGKFNLSTIAKNIDASKIKNLNGAGITGTTLEGLKVGTPVTYKYNIGSGFTMDVKLIVKKGPEVPVVPEVPVKPGVSTGDTTNMGLYAFLTLLSLGVISIYAFKKIKNREKK